MTKKTGIVAMAMLLLLLFIPNPGFAQLYKDKTVTVLIGHPAGGGIDRMARVFTDKLGDYIPGNPTMVVKTMPGAGGYKALNFLYAKAPKDGTLLWFGPVQFVDQLIGSKGIRFDYKKFEPVGAIRVPPVVMFGRTDIISSGFKSFEDILKADGLKLAGTTPKSGIDIQGRSALELLGVPFQYVTGYRGGAKIALAVQSGEANIAVTGFANYSSRLANPVKEGKMLGMWYYPYLDSSDEPIKAEAITDMPDFIEVYRKLKGKNPEGPAWEALKMILEFRSVATNMAMMPPDTDEAAVDILRKGWAEMMMSEEIKVRQNKVLGYTVESVPLSVTNDKLQSLDAVDPKRIENLKAYIAAGARK